ncbi:MAG: MarR family transcriptional regulator [Bacteroidetes bacterium]|nr:MarR family transcriptional regulator [Bacteroidota bacterium]MBX7128553.1 MarR family transcriptional regulator [Flavobacteriales bacterium]MCC6655627.1 MarR family transcriptional regulator [Flavobacteriales bacterium]HMU15487.1 MarR family transcriptional regulator [Flavobacteriales bacterium]HNM68410.1 MarR family transcriptional regulator [Flavobacteriales bacterium]
MATSSIGYWCSVAAHQYFARLQEKLVQLDITQWYYVLLTIDEGRGTLSQQQLADRLQLDKVTMTRAIDHLCEKGYVERCDCIRDRRKYLVKPTPKARPALRAIHKAYAALNDEALAGLKKADRAAFLGQLMMVVSNLHKDAAPVAITNKRVHA